MLTGVSAVELTSTRSRKEILAIRLVREWVANDMVMAVPFEGFRGHHKKTQGREA
jgi:hypothetical protein